jgi:CheY-like chemotaxis protein
MSKSDTYKILVVDDDQADRRLVSKILIKKFTVIEASNGKEAFDLARSEKPDIILMDIMMPEMDGYTALAAIKRDLLTAEIPVIMLTDLKGKLNIRLAEEWGASGYLTKSFKPQDLLDKVNQLI